MDLKKPNADGTKLEKNKSFHLEKFLHPVAGMAMPAHAANLTLPQILSWHSDYCIRPSSFAGIACHKYCMNIPRM
jgi:hypothetical protein